MNVETSTTNLSLTSQSAAIANNGISTSISPSVSLRLRSLRLPLAVGVVFAHCAGLSVTTAQGNLYLSEGHFFGSFLRTFVSNGIAKSSVPVSLLIAGFLLAVGFDSRMNSYVSTLKTKLRTLLIPFLIWNTLVLGLYALAQSVNLFTQFMSGKQGLIAQYSWQDILYAVFGIGRVPIAYQFWFVRDLMILILVSPLLLTAVRRLPKTILALLTILWLTDLWPISAPSSRAVLFFTLGMYLGAINRTGVYLIVLDRYGRVLTAVYGALLFIFALNISNGPHSYLDELIVAIGVPVWLYASKLILTLPKLHSWLVRYSTASFFVFAAHEPLLTVLLKIVYSTLAPVNWVLGNLVYLAIPLLLSIFLVYLHKLLSKKFPTLTNVITGGRK
jgi:hypothetical protein